MTDRVVAAAVAGTKANNLTDKLLNPSKKKKKKAATGASERKCGNCGQKGHNKTTCSNPKKVTVAELAFEAADQAGDDVEDEDSVEENEASWEEDFEANAESEEEL